MLDEIGAFGRALDNQRLRAQPSLLSSFDLCVCDLSALPPTGKLGVAADATTTPTLLVGSLDEILGHGVKNQQAPRDFLVKPWHPHDLLLRCFHLLQASGSAASPDRSMVEPTVIIADDDATTTTLIAALLRKHQVKAVIARDGGEAIHAAQNSQAQAMVLDVNMPKVNGFEVLQSVKHGRTTGAIKVAMLTSRQQETDVVRAFGLGADDYVVKPFNPLELVSRVKRLLRN
ncbi:MAG: response regulator transcription factor [Deltaproteobacteria bacterium]|nr:response regulator transcription factor [Deltaproteobacteria bacterium]